MVSPVPDASPSRRFSTVTVALVLGATLLIVTSAGVPLATASPNPSAVPPDGSGEAAPLENDTRGTVPGSAFGTVGERVDVYTVDVTVERKGVGAPERRLVARAARRGESFVLQERRVAPADRRPYRDEPARVASVRVNDSGYRLRVHENDRPETLEPHLLVRGNRTYGRVDPDHVRPSAVGYVGYVQQYDYVRAGTVELDGERLVRYDAVARRGDSLSRLRSLLAGQADVAGHALIGPHGQVREARLRVPEDVGYTELIYRVRPGEAPPVPTWVEAARELPPDPRETGHHPSAPGVRAYHTPSGIVLVANGTWTPPADARIAVLPGDRDAPVRIAALNGSRSLFRSQGSSRAARVLLRPDGDGGLRVTNTTAVGTGGDQGEALSFERPRRVLVDVDGVNHYDLIVRPAPELGSLGGVTAARLRPEHGGGRVLRVDDLRVAPGIDDGTAVILTVGNGTVSRSLTVPARNLSGDRFFLVRTPDGLAMVSSGAIAPRLSPTGGFAEQRFVTNATLTVAIDGVPVARRDIEHRLTQADETPVPSLLTGLTVETYDEPPDRALLGHGRELRAMDWSNHTFVDVHVWDYDRVDVRGDLRKLYGREGCLEDQTCFYRAPDGTDFRVETAQGEVLVAGAANGTRTVAP